MNNELFFNIRISLAAAAVAALVVLFAGFQVGARYETMFFRALIGCALVGGLVFLLSFCLEWFYREHHKEAPHQEWISQDESATEGVDAVDDDETGETSGTAVGMEAGTGSLAADNSEEAAFKPLADGVKHMVPPQE